MHSVTYSRLLVFSLICLGLFGIPTAHAEKTLVVGVQSGATSLDARQATDAASSRLLRLITLGLVRLDDNRQPVADAASKIEQNNPTTYTVHLRPLTYHDGTPLTAASVKALYDSIRAPEGTSPLKGLYSSIREIQTPAEDTLVFVLEKPNPFFWNLLLRPLVRVLPNQEAQDFPIGLGPYKVAAFSEAGDVTLVRAPTWTGAQPPLDTLVFKVVPDPLVRLLKLRNKELDLVQNDIPDVFYDYGIAHGLKGVSGEAATYTYIGFNVQDTATGNPAIREALSYAINRPLMMETLLGGRARPAQSVLPESHPAFWPAPEAPYDPERAKKILDAAGYTVRPDGTRLTLTFSVTNNPSILLLAQVLQQQLKDVGIDFKISSSEWGTFYGNIKKGNFQLFLLSWVGLFQPDFFQYVFHSTMVPPSGANRGRYVSSEMDRLIDALMSEPNAEKRNQLAVQVQQLQARDRVYLPLWRRDHLVLMQPYVHGYTPELDGGYDALLKTDILSQ